jgi:hypothetical protein
MNETAHTFRTELPLATVIAIDAMMAMMMRMPGGCGRRMSE